MQIRLEEGIDIKDLQNKINDDLKWLDEHPPAHGSTWQNVKIEIFITDKRQVGFIYVPELE